MSFRQISCAPDPPRAFRLSGTSPPSVDKPLLQQLTSTIRWGPPRTAAARANSATQHRGPIQSPPGQHTALCAVTTTPPAQVSTPLSPLCPSTPLWLISLLDFKVAHSPPFTRCTMPAPIVPDWGAFRRSDERHKKADGTPSNYWMAYCRACEAAHKKYLEDASACNGDRAAIANIAVVPPAEPLPGRRDRMTPHLNKCAFVKQSSPTDGAGDGLRNGGPSGVHHSLGRASSAVETPREEEVDLLTRLGITKY